MCRPPELNVSQEFSCFIHTPWNTRETFHYLRIPQTIYRLYWLFIVINYDMHIYVRILICVRLCACARERLRFTDNNGFLSKSWRHITGCIWHTAAANKVAARFTGLAFCSQVQSLFAAVEPLKMQSGPNQRRRTKVDNNSK